MESNRQLNPAIIVGSVVAVFVVILLVWQLVVRKPSVVGPEAPINEPPNPAGAPQAQGR